MEVFIHHIQEYKKGLRTLVLHTTKASERDAIEKKLKREMIDYYIQKVNGTKINVFFGNSICIDVIKQMNFESLSNLTDEEDFILGTMLGYDRLKQCERYLKRKRNGTNNLEKADSKSISLSQTELIGVVG
ncbi:MAG: DUF2023 family protein [Halobacteriota archaeon]